jgi:hypothetical protein
MIDFAFYTLQLINVSFATSKTEIKNGLVAIDQKTRFLLTRRTSVNFIYTRALISAVATLRTWFDYLRKTLFVPVKTYQ